MDEVAHGAPLPGLYPPERREPMRARYAEGRGTEARK